MEATEQVTFPPLPRDRHPATGHPLPDLPPYRRVPARQPHRGPDRALPPGPSRSTRPRIPVAGRGNPRTPTQPSSTNAARPRDGFTPEVSPEPGNGDPTWPTSGRGRARAEMSFWVVLALT